MPRKARHQQTSSIPAAETAPAADTDDYTKTVNLTVLRRYDSDIVDYLWVAPYAVVYSFSTEVNNWEKNGIEGSLFICQLQPNQESAERYKIVVLNRRGLDNLHVELRNEEQVEFTEQLIIFQENDAQSQPIVYGIWVFSEPLPSSTAEQPAHVTAILKQCLRIAQEGREARTKEVEMAYGHAPVQQENMAMHQGHQGHQLSLSEMFGQQRLQNEAWDLRNHGAIDILQEPPMYHPAAKQIYNPPTGPNFAMGNPLQALFSAQMQHSSPLPHMQHPQFVSPPQQQSFPAAAPLGARQQHLLGLFGQVKPDQS